MLEAILIPRIRKCTPKSFPTPISQQAKTYWPFILNNVLLLFITQKNISCETMRHVMVWWCAYNVRYDYSLCTNILPRQVLLYLIYHERVHSYCVSRVKVMGAEEGGRAEAERERDILLSSYPPLSWVYPCTAQYRRTQLETERSEEQWDPDQRPVAVTQTRGSPDSICCSLSRSPVLGVTQVVTRCDRSSVTSDTEDRLTWM